MKLLSALLSLVFISLNANAAQVTCEQKTPVGNQFSNFSSVKLVADLSQNPDELNNVVVTAVSSYDVAGHTVQTSRPGNLKAIPSKNKKSKYANLNHFDLTDLESENGGGFAPDNDCYINIFLPKNAIDLLTFEAPSNVHCEQSGGFVPYQCSVKKSVEEQEAEAKKANADYCAAEASKLAESKLGGYDENGLEAYNCVVAKNQKAVVCQLSASKGDGAANDSYEVVLNSQCSKILDLRMTGEE